MRKPSCLLAALILAMAVVAHARIPAGPGDIAWIQQFTGTPNGPDSARAIAVDAAGNAAITGTSRGEGTGMDIATIKYSPGGTQLWAARFNDADTSLDEAVDVAMDRDGNVLVTGYGGLSETDIDYTTIKYSPTGAELWVARYNSPANGGDYATALAVDDSGNVYVTGYCLSMLAINAEYATIKYNSAGVQQWVAQYSGTGEGNDYARDIAVDAGGRVYVTGESQNAAGNEDFVTVMYDAGGVQQWVATYNGSQNLADKPVELALDQRNHVVVTGSTVLEAGPPASTDYVTIEYDQNGNQLWSSFYAGPDGRINFATDLAVDGSNNVYVTGASTGTGGGLDFATIKYDAEGREQWVSRFVGPGGRDAVPNDIVLDAAGRSYVTGYLTAGSRDFATIRYEPDGSRGWTATYDGPAADDDAAVAIGLDGEDNVYVTGSGYFSGTGDDFLTIKYEANGVAIAEAGTLTRQAGTSLTSRPNPAHDRAVVTYAVRQSGPVRLSICRPDGAVVSVREFDRTAPGEYGVELDLRKLPAGAYFVRLEAKSNSTAGKLVVR